MKRCSSTTGISAWREACRRRSRQGVSRGLPKDVLASESRHFSTSIKTKTTAATGCAVAWVSEQM